LENLTARLFPTGRPGHGGNFAQFLDKLAKTVAKPKQNCLKISFKAKFESKDLHQTFLNSKNQIIFVPRNSHGPLKSSPNGKISPNLVTLVPYHKGPKMQFPSLLPKSSTLVLKVPPLRLSCAQISAAKPIPQNIFPRNLRAFSA
jgi:hypothetical protein